MVAIECRCLLYSSLSSQRGSGRHLHFGNKTILRFAAYLVILLLFAVLQFAPVQGVNDYTVYYNIHANTLDNAKMHQQALEYWRKSSEMNGRFSDSANLALASATIAGETLKRPKPI